MKDNNIDILPAAIALMKAAEDTGNENHVIWFLSVAYDMIIERKEPVK